LLIKKRVKKTAELFQNVANVVNWAHLQTNNVKCMDFTERHRHSCNRPRRLIRF
jgi:hypothetical protein